MQASTHALTNVRTSSVVKMNSDFNAVQTLACETAAAVSATTTDDSDDNSRLEAKRRRQATTTTATTAPLPPPPSSTATVIQQQHQQQASQIHQHQQHHQQQQQQLTLNHRDPAASANQLNEQPEPATIVNRVDGGNSSSAQSGGCSQVGPANQQPRKPCDICHHQEIPATPQAPESNKQQQQLQQQSPLTKQSKQKHKRHPNSNCDKGCSLLPAQSSSALCSRQQHCAPEQQSSAVVASATATAAADQAATDQQQAAIESLQQQQLDNFNSNNSFLFWKFLSNLPKSITQRSKSTTLAPEVAGYLASKQLQHQQLRQQQQLESQCNHHHGVMTVASLDEPQNKGAQLIQQQQQQYHHQYQMMAASKKEASEPQLIGCTQLSQDGQRLIKIVAPPAALLPLQDAGVIGRDQLQRPPTQHQHQPQQDRLQQHQLLQTTGQNRIIIAGSDGDLQPQPTTKHPSSSANPQQAKLSIATTTTTTRSPSCNSSLSSCILSDSGTSENRLRWDKKLDFLLSIIGFAVDLANVWRFPYLVYKNGGGVFLIAYVIMLIFGGIPLFFLELCLGQFVKKGPITVWNKICPSMRGVGYCNILISWYVSFYYNVLIAWAVYFIYRSLTSFGDKMPWEHCDNSWNTKKCLSISRLEEMCIERNSTLDACRKESYGGSGNVSSPASEFFVRELSQIDQSSGIDDMGILRPDLVLCLIVVYLLHYFSLFRGLETSGKVVWVTATAPYMILSILLVRGLFLPGASMGIEYYLSPKLEKLADSEVWIDAANQVFFSIGVGFGVHLTYASFNSHNNDCYRDCLVTSAANAATAVYTGLVVFVYLGYMAKNLGIEIDKVASEGHMLVFEVYPEALATFPFARFWTILFFIMLLTLGIDSAMGGLEAVITGLEDEFKFIQRLERWQLTALVIASSFLPALVGCTQGGAYAVFWLDLYSAGCSLLFAALFETIGVVYCYGLDKFILNIESMLGKKPHIFYIVCWKYISPMLLGVVIFMQIWQAQVPIYRNYTFPVWSVILGWFLAFSSVAAVPIVAIQHFCSRTPEKSQKRRDRGGTSSSAASKTVFVSCGSGGQGQRAQTTRSTVLTTTSHSIL